MAAVLYFIVMLVAMAYVLNQARQPDRWIGRGFLWAMNWSHSSVTDWGLQHAPIEKDSTILDVGCGGGRTIQKLAALATDGLVYGVDYADGSVAASRGTNAQLIKAGRVDIRQASVSHLPFPDDTFDLVTAVETHYYWPDLVQDMQEVRRVLKPGGTLIIIAERYRRSQWDWLSGVELRLLRAKYLTAQEHRESLARAGYTAIQIIEEPKQGWICGIGKKQLVSPAGSPALGQPVGA